MKSQIFLLPHRNPIVFSVDRDAGIGTCQDHLMKDCLLHVGFLGKLNLFSGYKQTLDKIQISDTNLNMIFGLYSCAIKGGPPSAKIPLTVSKCLYSL